MRLIFSLFFALQTLALPKSVEFIFLSPKKTKSTFHSNIEYKSIAINEDDCVPMGEGCFHPQHGFIEKKPTAKIIKEGDTSSVLDKKKDLKTINSAEADMIDCKEEKYFDIFCGKAKKINNSTSDLEIWIDTSSSMRRVDFSLEKDECYRKSFVKRLKDECEADFSTFDTSIKSLGGLNNLCLNYGLNDQKRLMDWIDRSEAKKLIIITDIDEASMELRDYLFKIGAEIKGADLGDFDGEKLLNHIEKISKSCSKPKS